MRSGNLILVWCKARSFLMKGSIVYSKFVVASTAVGIAMLIQLVGTGACADESPKSLKNEEPTKISPNTVPKSDAATNEARNDEGARPPSNKQHIDFWKAYMYEGHFDQASGEYIGDFVTPDGKSVIPGALTPSLPGPSSKILFERDRCVNDGVALQSQCKYPEAIAEYSKALKLDPRNEVIMINLGSAYLANKEFEKAYLFFQAALATNPHDAAAARGLQECNDRISGRLRPIPG